MKFFSLLSVLLFSLLNADAHFCDRIFHLFPSHKPSSSHTGLKAELSKPFTEVSTGIQIRYPHKRGSVIYGDGIMTALPENPVPAEEEQIHYGSKYELGHSMFVLFLNAHLEEPQPHKHFKPFGVKKPSFVVYTHFIYWPSKINGNAALDTQTVKKVFQNLYGQDPLLTIKEVLNKQLLKPRSKNHSPHTQNPYYRQAGLQPSSEVVPQTTSEEGEGKPKDAQEEVLPENPLEPFLCTTRCEKDKLKHIVIKTLSHPA